MPSKKKPVPQLPAIPQEHDNRGNLTGDGVWTYAYDADNKLKTASKSGYAATLAYDAEARLRRTTLAGIVTDLLYDGVNPVVKTDPVRD